MVTRTQIAGKRSWYGWIESARIHRHTFAVDFVNACGQQKHCTREFNTVAGIQHSQFVEQFLVQQRSVATIKVPDQPDVIPLDDFTMSATATVAV